MVYHLSHDGWCFKSLENIGKDLGMHKSSVVYMRDRLIHRKLLVKNKQGYVKTSVMYQKLVLTDEKPYQKLNAPYQKHVFAVPKSGTKNNIRATLDYKRPQKIVDKFGIETLQSMEARIKARAKWDCDSLYGIQESVQKAARANRFVDGSTWHHQPHALQ